MRYVAAHVIQHHSEVTTIIISRISCDKKTKTVSCTRVVVSSAADVPPLFFKATRGISSFAFTHMYDLHDVWLLVCSIWHMCPMPSRPQATTTTIRSLSNTLTFFDSVSARVVCVCDAFELWIRCHIYLFHDRATIKSETIKIYKTPNVSTARGSRGVDLHGCIEQNAFKFPQFAWFEHVRLYGAVKPSRSGAAA